MATFKSPITPPDLTSRTIMMADRDRTNIRLCFLHGLDSSPQGTKARLLKSYEPACLIPELPADIHARVKFLEDLLLEPVLLIGSSLGGLTALLYAMRSPGMVRGMVLCAPAVGTRDVKLFTEEEEEFISRVHVPRGIPAFVMAGLKDEVIPLEAIRKMVKRSPGRDDDHDLHRSLGLLIEGIEEVRARILSNPHGGGIQAFSSRHDG